MNKAYRETNTDTKEVALTLKQEQLISHFRFGTKVVVSRCDEIFENDWIFFSSNGSNVRVANSSGQ